MRSSIGSLDVAARDAVDDDDDSDADVWKADAVAAADGGRMEAALVHRVEEFEAAMTGFKPELETDGPRTGALGGSGGGESGKGIK